MATYYLDTSALVKHYLREPGTGWIQAVFAPALANQCFTVRISGPELNAALQRRVRTKSISATHGTRLAKTFRTDWQTQYRIIEVNEDLAQLAMNLAERLPLRGYDAVHLAAASVLHQQYAVAQLAPIVFVSADAQQLAAAVALGLEIENPEQHARYGADTR